MVAYNFLETIKKTVDSTCGDSVEPLNMIKFRDVTQYHPQRHLLVKATV